MTKTEVKWFTIADYQEEEKYLTEMHRKGYKFVKLILPCFFVFEECQPEDVVYRLDYKNNSERADYMQMVSDYGWECVNKKVGWLCFRKPKGENDDIFSDKASKLEMINHVFKTRLIPFSIFSICVLFNGYSAISNGDAVLTIIWAVLIFLYVFLVVYCNIKMRKLKKELEQ